MKSFVAALRDPEQTDAGARFVMALEGAHVVRLLECFRRDPAGARALAERRSVRPLLADHDRLRGLPEGSLGRAYLAFCEAEGFDIHGLVAATRPATDELIGPTPEESFLQDRITDQHDLWHVVTGYGRDPLGELALIVFGYEQLGQRAYAVFTWMAHTFMGLRDQEAGRLLRQARDRGRNASWLVTEDWEDLLPRPLDEVRERLGLGRPPRYVPWTLVDGRPMPAEVPEAQAATTTR